VKAAYDVEIDDRNRLDGDGNQSRCRRGADTVAQSREHAFQGIVVRHVGHDHDERDE
jgi:hypothetical protein